MHHRNIHLMHGRDELIARAADPHTAARIVFTHLTALADHPVQIPARTPAMTVNTAANAALDAPWRTDSIRRRWVYATDPDGHTVLITRCSTIEIAERIVAEHNANPVLTT
jgi:hypothetical protein